MPDSTHHENPSFQKHSVIEFYAELPKQTDAYAGRRIPWSSNNYDGTMEFPYDQIDFGTAELPHRSSKRHELYHKITGCPRYFGGRAQGRRTPSEGRVA
jgi:hypothetical protein